MNQSHFGGNLNFESDGYWDVYKLTKQIVNCPQMIATQPKQTTVLWLQSLARHLPVQNKANNYLSSLPYIHNQQKRSIAIQLNSCLERRTKPNMFATTLSSPCDLSSYGHLTAFCGWVKPAWLRYKIVIIINIAGWEMAWPLSSENEGEKKPCVLYLDNH